MVYQDSAARIGNKILWKIIMKPVSVRPRPVSATLNERMCFKYIYAIKTYMSGGQNMQLLFGHFYS